MDRAVRLEVRYLGPRHREAAKRPLAAHQGPRPGLAHRQRLRREAEAPRRERLAARAERQAPRWPVNRQPWQGHQAAA